LPIHQLIWRDFIIREEQHILFATIEAHNALYFFAREEELDMRGVVDTYCVQEGIDITWKALDIKGVSIQKIGYLINGIG
jgi:hypothetical protein